MAPMSEAETGGRATINSAARASDYVPALTGLRGVAAGWVLLFHLWQFSGSPALAIHVAHRVIDFTPLVACGFLGVDLFFGLSGFLLALPFHRAALVQAPMPSLRTFWIRRCRRVLPAYYVQLAIIVAAMLAIGETRALGPANLIGHVFLMQNFVPTRETLNGVYWTMPIEWDFYAVLPLLALALARFRIALTLFAVMALVVAFRLLCYRAAFDPHWARHFDYGWIVQLPARLDEFFFGVLAAMIHVLRPPSARMARGLVLLGMAGIAVGMAVLTGVGNYLLVPQMPWLLLHFTWIGAAFGMLILGAAAAQSWFRGRVLAWLGLVSYSLYLWHYPLLLVARHFGFLAVGSPLAMMGTAFVVTVPILLVSWLSQHFVERAFLVSHQRKIADLQEASALK
jgi:peptidoglycan/LPS O-acetylase OafA/YrhL